MIDRMGVLWLLTHAILLLSFLAAYVVLKINGFNDDLLGNLLLLGGGWFFGAVTKEAVNGMKKPDTKDGDTK